MRQEVTNKKHVARNTLMLYASMLLSTLVTLYTSRVVLNTLGVHDFGLYSLIGGFVMMFSFLNAAMSGATSRFLTFALGKQDKELLKKTFSSALLTHFIIALIVFILTETIGLWLLMNKLQIPENSRTAAFWVYQCSIFTAIINITQVPYNASIISHEKIDLYAKIEFFNIILKLLTVLLLVSLTGNKLILYALLVMATSLVIASFYRWYCITYFEECHFHFTFEKRILSPMLSFSGWGLIGYLSNSLQQQGLHILLNYFFGVILNAANGLSLSVGGAVKGFTESVVQAFRPQIIKSHANSDIAAMEHAIQDALTYISLLYCIIAMPLIFELPFILRVWLGTNPPPYTLEFITLLIFINYMNLINTIIKIAIQATGQIKSTSILTSLIYICSIIVSAILFYLGQAPTTAYTIILISELLILVCNSALTKQKIPQISICVILKRILILLFFTTVPCIFLWIITLYFSPSFTRLLANVALYATCLSLLTFLFIFNRTMKQAIKQRIIKHFSLK